MNQLLGCFALLINCNVVLPVALGVCSLNVFCIFGIKPDPFTTLHVRGNI